MSKRPIPIAEARRMFAMPEAQVQATNPGFVSPKLRVVDPVTLEGVVPPERRWVVKDWIPHGSVTMINGDGGVGKTLLAQMLMTCCAAGRSWLGHETTNFKALGIFCEDDEDELHRRQLAINEHYDLDWCDLENMGWYSGVAKENALHIFNREYWQWDPSQFFQEVHDVASDGGYQMIVLDSLHDLFAGNENARPEVRRFIQMLHSLACDIDGTVVLSAHPSKAGRADGTGESGSTAWNNSVRSRLYLTRPKDDEDNEEDEDSRVLTRQKSNYARIGDGVRLRWQDGAFEVEQEAFGVVAGIEKDNVEKAFLIALGAVVDQGFEPSPHESARDRYAAKLVLGRREVKGLKLNDLKRVLKELINENRAVLVEVKASQGRPKKIVVPADHSLTKTTTKKGLFND